MMFAQKKQIKVAIGVIKKDQTFLLSLRPAELDQGGLWEFPGGKIEQGETSFEALCRELVEELGIHVNTAYPWPTLYHSYQHSNIELHPWLVTSFSGNPAGLENQAINWISFQSLLTLSMPQASYKVIQLSNLLLPKR